jgi:hypothetical protein
MKQQHTSILTTKSTYRSLNAQRLSERTVYDCKFQQTLKFSICRTAIEEWGFFYRKQLSESGRCLSQAILEKKKNIVHNLSLSYQASSCRIR